MARWFYLLCAVLIAVMSVIDANGCDCSTKSVRKYLCSLGNAPWDVREKTYTVGIDRDLSMDLVSEGQCTRPLVQQAQERCLLRCKRTDPAENQPNWQQSSTRKEDKPWSDVTELQSGDSQCLFDDVYRTFTPVWQERIIKLLKEAVADSTM